MKIIAIFLILKICFVYSSFITEVVKTIYRGRDNSVVGVIKGLSYALLV